MPQFKSLLKRHVVETAQRKRTCKHDKLHLITKGQKCLVVYEGDRRRYVYCAACAKEMLRVARDRIDAIPTQFFETAKGQPL